MALSKVKSEALVRFSSDLKGKHDDILRVKNTMDRELQFHWDDPIGQNFISTYHERMKPIEGKLLPNLVAYSQYLDQLAARGDEFKSNLL